MPTQFCLLIQVAWSLVSKAADKSSRTKMENGWTMSIYQLDMDINTARFLSLLVKALVYILLLRRVHNKNEWVILVIGSR